MISDQPQESPVEPRLVDLEAVADNLSAALAQLPGILRLEPTVKSMMNRLRALSLNSLHRTTGSGWQEPRVVARDGLLLSAAGEILNVQIDVATDVAHPAVEVAETAQKRAAEIIRKAGLQVGSINVTILAIEGSPTPAHLRSTLT
ncbi:hypothetical protein [Arthrobacter sp. H41]|uniref:hypothetical protein n=1 Tax=Arthrobacter sp. H41 TaxID=1312978 RepID=UPI00047B8715|nr:hypothetical protein [Arthrobacter sp. H41]